MIEDLTQHVFAELVGRFGEEVWWGGYAVVWVEDYRESGLEFGGCRVVVG